MPDLINNTTPIVIRSVPLADLIRTYNLTNLQGLSNTDTHQLEGKAEFSQASAAPAFNVTRAISLKFESVTYKDFLTGYIQSTFDLQYLAVLCNVTQPKIIVETMITGSKDGAINEYIGEGNIEVTINGIIAGINGQYPEVEVNALQKMLKAPVPIPVVSSFLNNLGIFNLIVTNSTINQDMGGISTQAFSINCKSDTPLELQIK